MNFDPDSIERREGEVAIVTGANSGVGFEVAVGLARIGCTVVMACRNMEKARLAKAEILAREPEAKLDILQLDLSDYASIKAFAEDFRSQYVQLDLLINNAGLLDYSLQINNNGIERQFATNHLGHFLLTALLIDLMPNSSSSRVVSLSSLAHKKAEIFFDDLNCEQQTKWDAAYCQSKLACLMFADELQRRLQQSGSKVLSVCAHPGGTDSGLFENMPKLLYYAMKIFVGPFILHSNESAARSILIAALGNEVKGGEYFGPQGFLEMKGAPGIATRTEYSKDEAAASRLWDISETMTDQKFDLLLDKA